MTGGMTDDDIVFRMSKRAFITGEMVSFVLVVFIIGIPMLLVGLIQYKTRSLTIARNGLVYRSGLLNTEERTIPYSQINSVHIRTPEPYSRLRYGTVSVMTGNDVVLRFGGLDEPRRFKELVEARL